MKYILFVFAFALCALQATAQTPQPLKGTISNLSDELAPYIPTDPVASQAPEQTSEWKHFGETKKPADDYASAFVTKYTSVASRVEAPAMTTSFVSPQAKGDHHILKNIGKGFLIGAGIAGLAVLNVERCQLEASNYPLFLRRAAYRACMGY